MTDHIENKAFLPVLCHLSHSPFLVSTVAAIYIPIKYNFSFSLKGELNVTWSGVNLIISKVFFRIDYNSRPFKSHGFTNTSSTLIKNVCLVWLTKIKQAFAVLYLWVGHYFFFSIWVFSHNHSQITGLQEKGEGISLTSTPLPPASGGWQ